MLVFNVRHQVHIVLALDDEDALPGVPVGVRVFEDVEQVATLDVEDEALEPDTAVRPELRVFRVVPGEVLDCLFSVPQRVPERHTLASSGVCPKVCPNAVRGPSSGSQRQPSLPEESGRKSLDPGLIPE